MQVFINQKGYKSQKTWGGIKDDKREKAIT